MDIYSIPNTLTEAKELISDFFCASPGKLNTNCSKKYNILSEVFRNLLKAESHIGVKTLMYCIINDILPKGCDHCGKQTDVYNFTNGNFARFCCLECKFAFDHNTSSSETIFTDYESLKDQYGHLSESKVSKYLLKNSIDYLKSISPIKTDDIKTLLFIQYYGTEKLRYCQECNVLLPIRWCKRDLPYSENKHFCSNECRNKNEDYTKNLSVKKLGIGRNESQKYRDNVSVPWFYEKLNRIQTEENISMNITYEDYLEHDSSKRYKCYCNVCNHEFEYTFISKTAFCPKCNLQSKPQKKLVDFAESFGFKIIVNDKQIIKPYELDIVIPELNLAIEYSGNWWHRNKEGFHKFKKCKELGLRLIEIYSDEDFELVKSRLAAAFGKSQNKIYARNCIIKELTPQAYSDFMKLNHTQGSVPASVKLGLYENDILVAAMSFGSCRYSKKFEWELLRFATNQNTTVIGGASKLFSYFIKNYNPESILSYCDVRWGSGKMYEKLGFTFFNHTKSNYYWCKAKRESRIKYQKHKLSSIFSNVDMSKSEDEIMFEHGFYKIYDYGNYVYHWNRQTYAEIQ